MPRRSVLKSDVDVCVKEELWLLSVISRASTLAWHILQIVTKAEQWETVKSHIPETKTIIKIIRNDFLMIMIMTCPSLFILLFLRATTMMSPSSRRISWPTTTMLMSQPSTPACTSASAKLAKPREATGSRPLWPWHTFFPGYDV